MNIKNIKEVFDWLAKNFEDNFYYEQKENYEGLKNIIVSIYDEDEGWKSKTLYFNNQGNVIPNYARQKEIKQQIKQLQEELAKIQKEA